MASIDQYSAELRKAENNGLVTNQILRMIQSRASLVSAKDIEDDFRKSNPDMRSDAFIKNENSAREQLRTENEQQPVVKHVAKDVDTWRTHAQRLQDRIENQFHKFSTGSRNRETMANTRRLCRVFLVSTVQFYNRSELMGTSGGVQTIIPETLKPDRSRSKEDMQTVMNGTATTEEWTLLELYHRVKELHGLCKEQSDRLAEKQAELEGVVQTLTIVKSSQQSVDTELRKKLAESERKREEQAQVFRNQIEQQHQAWKENLDALSTEKDNKLTELEALHKVQEMSMQDDKEREILDLQQKLATSRRESEQAMQKYQDLQAQMNNTIDQRLEDLRGQLVAKQTEAANRENTVRWLRERVKELEDNAKTQKALEAQLRSDLDADRKRLEEQEASIEDLTRYRDDVIPALNAELDEKLINLANLEAEKERLCEEARRQADETKGALWNVMEIYTNVLNQETSKHASSASEKDQKLADMAAQMTAAKAATVQRDEDIRELLDSILVLQNHNMQDEGAAADSILVAMWDLVLDEPLQDPINPQAFNWNVRLLDVTTAEVRYGRDVGALSRQVLLHSLCAPYNDKTSLELLELIVCGVGRQTFDIRSRPVRDLYRAADVFASGHMQQTTDRVLHNLVVVRSLEALLRTAPGFPRSMVWNVLQKWKDQRDTEGSIALVHCYVHWLERILSTPTTDNLFTSYNAEPTEALCEVDNTDRTVKRDERFAVLLQSSSNTIWYYAADEFTCERSWPEKI